MSEAPRLTADDRLDIMELMLAYGRALDSKDAAAYAALFAPDGVRMSYDGTRIQRGRSEIQVEIQRTLDTWTAKVRHFMAPSNIEGNGNRCNARTYVQECVEQPEGPVYVAQVAEYHDICVKLNGRWYLQERRIEMMLNGRGEPLKTR
jgi:uncharacterized protein (TIGR02246 family)